MNKNKPCLVIGICGASSSGKTNLLKYLYCHYNKKNITHLDMDGYHFHSRKQRDRYGEYPEQLEANNFAKLIDHIESLVNGKNVRVPIYDHMKGEITSVRSLSPRKLLVIEGLHASSINKISGRRLVDLTIFIDTDEELRKAWKMKRDVQDREYSEAQAISQIANRKKFEIDCIEPQIKLSDVIFRIIKIGKDKVDHALLISEKSFISRGGGVENPDQLKKYFNSTRIENDRDFYFQIDVRQDDADFNNTGNGISEQMTSRALSCSYSRECSSYEETVRVLFQYIDRFYLS